MTKLLIKKLEHRDALSDEEKDVLTRSFTRFREARADEDIVREGDRPNESCLIIEGFAARYKLLPNGRRQIAAIHIAGDFVDLHSFLIKRMDHGVVTLSPCRLGFIPHANLKDVTERYPHLTRMLWLSTLIDAAIARQWLTAMGRSSATAQMAHLLCELWARLDVVGLTQGNSFRLPLTQEEIGDSLGLSTVHVNRVLTELKGEGLVEWQGRDVVNILNWDGLCKVAQFSTDYLCVEREPR